MRYRVAASPQTSLNFISLYREISVRSVAAPFSAKLQISPSCRQSRQIKKPPKAANIAKIFEIEGETSRRRLQRSRRAEI